VALTFGRSVYMSIKLESTLYESVKIHCTAWKCRTASHTMKMKWKEYNVSKQLDQCLYEEGPSWSWSYGNWIYNYLFNQCLSPLTWVRIPLLARCTQYNIMWLSLSVTCDRSVAFYGYSGFIHQESWPLGYDWNIVQSGVKHHKLLQNNKLLQIHPQWHQLI
jgi:hypothetical protein